MLRKLAIIGTGNIGAVLIEEAARRHLAKVIAAVDVKEPDVAKGKALDCAEGLPIVKSDVEIIGSRDFSVIAGADIVVNTAGVPRSKRPDGTIPSREELLATNLKITDGVAAAVKQNCPEAIVINVANPLDAIVYRLYQKLGAPKNRILGMAGQLDSARYRYFVAQAAKVSVDNVEAMVLGGHGDDMVPIRSACRIAGLPVTQFINEDTLAAIEKRTRGAGAEVVGLLGSGSAFVSPAWAALDMVEAIAYDRRKIIASCVLLEGEFGVNGLFVGVPAILGKNGVEKVIEFPLNDAEKAAFAKSMAAVQKTVNEVKAMSA
ncbi:MAG: malate dehydrogenase [Planctomycetes bacterium]|jgi:malate dehydrogenase|nr:malate dehydrogenase [Planctomycetota bacterium]